MTSTFFAPGLKTFRFVSNAKSATVMQRPFGRVSQEQQRLQAETDPGQGNVSMGPDWESTYLALVDMVPSVERMLTEETGGTIVNRNWFAGADQWFFSKEPLQTLEDF